MLKFIPTEQDYVEAERRLAHLPILSGSHRGYQANEVGVLGELIFERFMRDSNIKYKSQLDKTTHDYLVGNRELVMEVKTKDRKVEPRPNYDCSAPAYNYQHQKVDAYAFMSLQMNRGDVSNNLRRFHTCWFVGIKCRDSFQQDATLWRAGEIDPSNGTKFWTDCLNVSISLLDEPSALVQHANAF